ncbi:GTP-binding protein Rhes [Clonorchis sinensis]|uniref:GTP-binding protein Rhes n=1 Tax=Clonorchis sinensis TaxID=79923 RepID=A0A8T1M886_CLOSI|nr:GTP-binding protein Rhes [Clonorchis sinensis]
MNEPTYSANFEQISESIYVYKITMKSMSFKEKRPQPITINSTEARDMSDSPADSPVSPTSGSNQTSKSEESVKVVVLGSAKVGKTSIIQRFLYNRFEAKYIPTVEDMHTKKLIARDHIVRLVLIDTAGSFDFPAMIRLCIDKAHAFILVFSHDNPSSLVQAGIFLNQIKSQRKDYAPLVSTMPHNISEKPSAVAPTNTSPIGPGSPPITVVCNKSDLPLSCSRISESVIMEWLLTNGLKPSQFVYASAKSNDSIQAIFKSLWIQNETTKSIQLEPWDNSRRSSIHSVRPQTPTLPVTDFSALSGTVPQAEEGGDGPNNTESEKTPFKSRPNLFRSSLRLARRTSSKHNKAKPEFEHVDCVIS